MIRIEEYLTTESKSPFGEWFLGLDPQTAAIVTVALGRLGDGNTGNTKPIGEGAEPNSRSTVDRDIVFISVGMATCW